MSLDTRFKQQLDLASAPTNWDSIPYPPPPFLTTKRLIVRRYHIRDAPRLADIANDKDVAQNLSFPHPYTLNDAAAWIAQSRVLDAHGNVPALFCIVAKPGVADGQADAPADGQSLVGGIGLTVGQDAQHAHSAELGYFLGRPYWGTGFVSEAGFALLGRVFGEAWGGPMPLQRVWARVAADNEAAVRLLIRLGLRDEAQLRNAIWKDGVAVDELIKGITRRDWELLAQESDEEEMDTDYEDEDEDEEDYSLDSDGSGDDEDSEADTGEGQGDGDKMETDDLTKKH